MCQFLVFAVQVSATVGVGTFSPAGELVLVVPIVSDFVLGLASRGFVRPIVGSFLL